MLSPMALLLDRHGWLAPAPGVTLLPSPNRDARPPGAQVSLLVLHNISLPPGQFGGSEVAGLFLNTLDHASHPWLERLRGLRVSAHFFIRRDGRIIQFVSTEQRAWHAGVSRFGGRERCNDFSIGIELEGTDDLPYTDAQYAVLEQLTRHIRSAWPAIDLNRIQGHSDIAPQRKTDPGPAFDWPRYRQALQHNEDKA